jgi:hypothetical protein
MSCFKSGAYTKVREHFEAAHNDDVGHQVLGIRVQVSGWAIRKSRAVLCGRRFWSGFCDRSIRSSVTRFALSFEP